MTDDATEPIHGCIERWHQHLRGRLDGGLDTILHEDCVFLSPIVFTPQHGRTITKMYLRAAGGTLAGAAPDGSSDQSDAAFTGDGPFRYTKEIRQGHHALLEFETEVEGTYVNGVDIITCDDDGAITEFRVMIRPLQAVNVVHAQMRTMLERMSDG